MTICCNICHAPINDENSIIMDKSYTVYHRNCFCVTMDNYCKIVEIGSLENMKKKYSFLNDKVVKPTAIHTQPFKKIG
jgi:ribosomal protein S26